jgi:LysR family transcriptional regulator, nitrogen assimilation regulatory protein
MEIQQLRGFVAVADHQSFTKAAQALNVSQPALSQVIAKLEEEFRTELFTRSPRRVEITAAGAAILEPARAVLHAVEDTLAAVSAVHGVQTGAVTLIAFKSFTTEAANVAADFHKAYPDIEIRIKAPRDDAGVYAAVSAGEADVGLARIAGAHDVDLSIEHVGQERSVVLLPADSELAQRGTAVTIDELSAIKLIVAPRGTQARALTDALFTDNKRRYQVAAECDHHESSIELVAGGVGAYLTTRGSLPGAVPESIALRDLKPERLWPIGLITRTARTSPATRAFAAHALTYWTDRGDTNESGDGAERPAI